MKEACLGRENMRVVLLVMPAVESGLEMRAGCNKLLVSVTVRLIFQPRYAVGGMSSVTR